MDTTPTHPLKRVIILGANGQLGSLLHQYLSVHLSEAAVMGCVRNVITISGSYIGFNPFTDDWQKLGKTDVLINCIGIIKETPQTTFAKAHEGITQLILKHRALLGNPRIIQMSALGADVNNPIPFLRTKGRADQMLIAQPDTSVVRPSIVCIPDTMLAQKLKLLIKISQSMINQLLFPEHLLKTRIQPIMPIDLGAIVAEVCCLENPPPLVHAVGPSPLSLQQLIELSSGKQVHFIKLSKKVSDRVAHLISFLFPKLLTQAQYQLLQTDNMYAGEEAEHILGRKLLSTEKFWQNLIKTIT